MMAACLCAAGVLGGGCQSMRGVLEGLDRPRAKVTDVRLTGLSFTDATVALDVEVANPYDVPLPLAELRYALASEGKRFVEGASVSQTVVPKRGVKVVPVTAKVSFAELRRVVSGVKPGATVPYEAEVEFTAKSPQVAGVGGGELIKLPASTSGKLYLPAAPTVSLKRIQWDELNLSSARGAMELEVSNPNTFGFELTELTYRLSLGGSDVAEATMAQAATFAGTQSRTIAVPLRFDPARAGLVVLQALQSGEAGYRLEGRIAMDTPYGKLDAPYRREGRAGLIQP